MRFASLSSLGVVLALAICGCGSDGINSRDSSTPTDASRSDATPDGAAADSAVNDAGSSDASATDAGSIDGAVSDAGSGDGSIDGAISDSGASADSGAPGETCGASAPCASGAVCVGGPACGDSWSCVSAVACTDDVVAFCGCDGRTFTGSSTCNTQPIAHRGSCEAGANCDRSAVTCRRVEPVCPDGQVGEVEGACWTGRCVGIDECACTTAAECPMPDRYTCHGTSGRCGPYL